MQLTMSVDRAVEALDRWYSSKCDGSWEQHLGAIIQTTDNPGWLFSFKELQIDQGQLANVIGDFLRCHQAQIVRDGISLRVFAPSLAGCIVVAALLTVMSAPDSKA